MRAAFWLLRVDLGLRVLGFSRVRAFPRRRAHRAMSGESPELSLEAIEHTCELVALMGRHHLYPMSCLTRALASRRILAGQGIWLPLRIGVRREKGQLRAHAWLEYQGRPVGEPADVETAFRPLLAREEAESPAGNWAESRGGS
jgi:hypothetical protein